MKKKILIKDGRLWLDNICLVPIISGKVSMARHVKETFLNIAFDCLAIGLPESFFPLTLQGVQSLPYINVLLARERDGYYHHFPIDPCDGMVEAIRLAMQEGQPIRFIDREMGDFSGPLWLKSSLFGYNLPQSGLVLPDEYAVDKIGFSAYIQAVFPTFTPTKANSLLDQQIPYSNLIQGKKERRNNPPLFHKKDNKIGDDFQNKTLKQNQAEDIQAKFMASQLQELSLMHGKVLFVFSVHHLPALLHYYQTEFAAVPNGKKPYAMNLYSVHPDSLYLILGEIPYLTYLYEKIKGTLSFEEFEKTEGIKKLFMETRDEYHKKFSEEIYRVSLGDIQTALHYIRNLCLLKYRLTPDLYEMVVAAKGVMGNDFALALIETAKFYPFMDITPPYPTIKMTDQSVRLGHSVFPAFRRVPTLAKEWKRISLEKKPSKKQKKKWKTYWNPNTVCSWPPEDEIIEDFCGYIRKRALKLAGLSHVRVEEFKSTLKDGIHLRETLRNWHMGKIYVKEEPQIHGQVGAVIFIFDEDQNGQKYPYKLTWLAEHEHESTLAFYATDFKNDLVGPGMARCFYGGALFIYPPQLIADVWKDGRFTEAADKAELLMMAGLYYSEDRYVAVVAKKKPSLAIKNYAALQKKKLIFLPLSSFSHTTMQKLRYFHVLNGKHVRSWASHFIR